MKKKIVTSVIITIVFALAILTLSFITLSSAQEIKNTKDILRNYNNIVAKSILKYNEKLDEDTLNDFKIGNTTIRFTIINKDGTESLYEKTNISSEYLTETDLINMQDGLEIYGKEELNKIIEDFE